MTSRRPRRAAGFASLLLAGSLLAACGGAGRSAPTAEPTAASTPTEAAARSSPAPTATTPAETATPAPTVAVPATPTPAAEAAPELGTIDAWYNSQPLTLADLRGKPVLLVFWSDI